MSLSIGDRAPEFTLKDDTGAETSLSSLLEGGPVTLVFIPFAFSGICRGELCEIKDNYDQFRAAGTRVVMISCDARPVLAAWKAAEGFDDFTMLTDFWPHGEVARRYGAFDEQVGCARRQTVVVGADGSVVDLFVSGGIGEARELGSYTDALAKL